MSPEKYKESIKKFYGNDSDDIHIVVDIGCSHDVADLAHMLFNTDQYGNIYESEIHWINPCTMAQIYVLAGIFSSITQAKKNGKDIPIPLGYSEHKLGKKKRRVFILHIGEE